MSSGEKYGVQAILLIPEEMDCSHARNGMQGRSVQMSDKIQCCCSADLVIQAQHRIICKYLISNIDVSLFTV